MYRAEIPEARVKQEAPEQPLSAVAQRMARFDQALAEPQDVHTLTSPEAGNPRPRTEPDNGLPRIDMWLLVSWMWNGKFLIAACVIIGIALAMVASIVIPPRYTVYTDILINPSQLQLPSDELYAVQREGQLEVGSRLRILTSTAVLADVVERLSLHEDPEFTGLLPGDEDEARLAALRSLYERVWARRDGTSYVVTLSVWSSDSFKAIAISEAIVAAFRAEITAADVENSMRAAASLNERLDALRERANLSAASVETYRRDNQLQGSGGELLSGQSLSQLNAQVNTARAALFEAQANHAELSILRGNALAGLASIEAPVLTEVRTRYAELRREYSAQSAIFGPRHPSVATLQSQLSAVESEVNAEIARMVSAARAEMDRAQAVLDQLLAQLDGVRDVASQDNEALVRLRELEREAEVQTAIYEAYLQRTAEIVESGQIDATNIRVISPPVPAMARDWPPRTPHLMMLGALGGLVIGIGFALMIGGTRLYWPVLRPRLLPARS